MPNTEQQSYKCPVRNLMLTMTDNVGRRCYLGSETDLCLQDGKICDIYQQHAQTSPKSTDIPSKPDLCDVCAVAAGSCRACFPSDRENC